MNAVATIGIQYADVKLRKQGDRFVLLASCPCGEIHEFDAGTKEAFKVSGLRIATCGKSLFTTLDANDQETNAHLFDVLQFQGKSWRHKKAVRSIKRRRKLIEALKQCERDLLIEKYNAAVKALKASPNLLESMRRMEMQNGEGD